MVLRIQVDKYTIALVSDWYYPKAGGIEYSVDSLARNLQALGHEVHIITKNNDGVPWKDSLPVIRLKGKVIAERLILPAAYKDLYRILRLAAARGRVEAVERDRYYAREALERFTEVLNDLGRAGVIIPATIRDRLGISRKYLIPLLEWADGQGITVREGDGRRLKAKA
jgi:glycosyltransferase involved in cell wall biosynthesis